jgi:hypothetical protein
MGSTRPVEAAPGSVRHDFALEVGRNLTHASDSVGNTALHIASTRGNGSGGRKRSGPRRGGCGSPPGPGPRCAARAGRGVYF